MISKTDRAKQLFLANDFKGALKIVKSFKMGISKKDKRSLEITWECSSNLAKISLYKSITFNVMLLFCL